MATDYLDKVLEAICALPLQSLDDGKKDKFKNTESYSVVDIFHK